MKLLVPALLAALVAPALAAVGSSASLTGLRYELVDLDANDGIAPSVKFTGVSDAIGRAHLSFCNVTNGCSRAMGDFLQPAAASVTVDLYNSAFANASTAGLFAGGVYNNNLTGSRLHTDDTFDAFAGYRGIAGKPLFVLSANTGLRVTGQYTLDAWVDPYREVRNDLRGVEGSQASVFFQSRFIEGPGPRQSIQAAANWITPADFQHATGEISALFRNDEDHQATLWGRWGVRANGDVPAIPEPSTWALMLGGLAMVGAMARRRQRRCCTAPTAPLWRPA